MQREPTNNVSVTIPSSISVAFRNSGENSISEFAIHNSSLVPISIDKVKVTECNEWKLCDKGEAIPVNTKQMAFVLETQCLQAGDNELDLVVKENSSRSRDIQIARGAWTTNKALETAVQMEFEYHIGQKEFQLKFDLNGGTQSVAPQMVCNGDTISYRLQNERDMSLQDGRIRTEICTRASMSCQSAMLPSLQGGRKKRHMPFTLQRINHCDSFSRQIRLHREVYTKE